jgi:hypothetical protein
MNPESATNPDPKPVRSLIEIPLPKETYEADLEVTDRYQKFSAEILRLSLAGIGVFGFVLKEIVFNKEAIDATDYGTAFLQALWWFACGLLSLGLAAALALAHRYYASDCIAIQVHYLRAKIARENPSPDSDPSEAAKFNSKMQADAKDLKWTLKLCGWILFSAATALGLGIALITLGLVWTLVK